MTKQTQTSLGVFVVLIALGFWAGETGHLDWFLILVLAFIVAALGAATADRDKYFKALMKNEKK